MRMQRQTLSKQSILSLIMLGMLSLACTAPFLISRTSDEAFATEPWLDPHEICTTQWVYPEYDINNPELIEALADLDLISTQITTEQGRGCYGEDGTPYYVHHDITVNLVSTDAEISDPEQMGRIIQQVIAAVSRTEVSQGWGDIDVITIQFVGDDALQARWRINYEEAIRAHLAGLTGISLYEIGE